MPTTRGMTIDEMRDAVAPLLPDDLFPGGAKVGWWSKAVQLDLEAKGLIARQSSTPLRLRRTERSGRRETAAEGDR